MPLTLAEAAQATGLNRSTILRAIKNGRISGQRDGSGVWSVEPVELHRVFPPAEAKPKALPQHAQADAHADALIAELRAQLADMRAQRDAWQAQAERLALAAPKPEPVTWWRWLRSTGCLAGLGVLLALSTMPVGAQQQPPPPQQRECFTVIAANNPSAVSNLGAILLDRCTGKTWSLDLSNVGGLSIIRWRPITVEAAEPTVRRQ
jgi:excisionase family DNA binding protein